MLIYISFLIVYNMLYDNMVLSVRYQKFSKKIKISEEKMKKILSGILCAMLALSMAACGGSGNNSGSSVPADLDTKTVIKVQNFPGGIGSNWLYKAAERFQEQYKYEHFENGKMGVYVDITPDQPNSSTLSTSAYHIIFDERYSNIYELAQKGSIIKLDDLVTEKGSDGKSIEDRIYASNRESLKGADGSYYALPHYEWFPGLSYDRDNFDKNNWYIAKDAENGKLIENEYGSLYLIKSASAKKSCGPDGKFKTDDDGLPSSLEELLILSRELKNKTGAGPFTVTGSNLYYTNYLVEGLWASLAGSEELKAVYDFNGSVDVVTGYTDENLFKGIDYIKKPIVTKTTITDENGNLALKSAARYYATAFIEILHKEGFFSDISSSVSHTGAQKNFINGGVRSNSIRAFLVDGSYWYNESVDQGSFKDYTTMTGKTTRGVRFMPLPVTATGSVTPSETATKPSLIDNGIAYAYINARYSDKTDIVKACKTFLKFLYSDAELKEFTALTGVTRPLTYSLTEAQYDNLPEYQQKVYDLSRNSNILYFGSENPIFKNNQQTFKIHFSSQIMSPKVNNAQYKSYYEAIKGGATSKNVFEATIITNEVWDSIVNK